MLFPYLSNFPLTVIAILNLYRNALPVHVKVTAVDQIQHYASASIKVVSPT